MSLTALNWKQLPPTAVGGTGAMDDLLDAIYTAFQSATYANGDARSAGSGSAWTVSRFQNVGTTEAVYGTPPTDTLNQRFIIAGVAGAATPSMAAPDSYTNDVPMASLNKNSGAFNAWDNAAPFTSGQFFGYWKFGAAAKTWAQVYCYESQEAIHVVIRDDANELWCCTLGAWVDPESTDGLDAESDGKLYCVQTQGTTAIPAVIWSAGGNTIPWLHATGNNQAHCGVFDIGAVATNTKIDRLGSQVAINSTNLVSRSGRLVKAPLHFSNDTNNWIGRAREIYVVRDAQTNQKIQVSGTDNAYLISGSISVDEDAWGLGA